MEMRELGRTGLRVTPIGLGLAALGRPAYITTGRSADLGDGEDRSIEAMEARSHEVLDAAWAAGIRYLDAARSYGYAERFLASWLRARAVDPADVTVGSKWGYRYVGEWRMDAPVHEVKDHSISMLRAQLPESRELLGPWLRLYQVHSATLESGILADARRPRGARAAARRGRARHRAERQRAAAGRRRARGARGARRRRQPVRLRPGDVERARAVGRPGPRRGARGRVGRHREGGARERPRARGRRGAAPIAAAAERHGTTRDAIALAAALAQPWAGVVLSGAATPDQLRSNVGRGGRWRSRPTRSRRCSRSPSRPMRTGRPAPPAPGRRLLPRTADARAPAWRTLRPMPRGARSVSSAVAALAVVLATIGTGAVAAAQPVDLPPVAASPAADAVAATSQVVVRWSVESLDAATPANRRVAARRSGPGRRPRRRRGPRGGLRPCRSASPARRASTASMRRWGRTRTGSLRRLQAIPGVVTAEADPIATIDALPERHRTRASSGATSAPRTARRSASTRSARGGRARATGTVIAILDTGIRAHADLAGQTVAGYDMIADTFTAGDGDGRDADPTDPGDFVDRAGERRPLQRAQLQLARDARRGDRRGRREQRDRRVRRRARHEDPGGPRARQVRRQLHGHLGRPHLGVGRRRHRRAAQPDAGRCREPEPGQRRPVPRVLPVGGHRGPRPRDADGRLGRQRRASRPPTTRPRTAPGWSPWPRPIRRGKRAVFGADDVVELRGRGRHRRPGHETSRAPGTPARRRRAPTRSAPAAGRRRRRRTSPRSPPCSARRDPEAQPAALERALTSAVTAFGADATALGCPTLGCGAGIANAPAALAFLATADIAAPSVTITPPASPTKAASLAVHPRLLRGDHRARGERPDRRRDRGRAA